MKRGIILWVSCSVHRAVNHACNFCYHAHVLNEQQERLLEES